MENNLWIVFVVLATVFGLLGLAVEWLGERIAKGFHWAKGLLAKPQPQEPAAASAGGGVGHSRPIPRSLVIAAYVAAIISAVLAAVTFFGNMA